MVVMIRVLVVMMVITSVQASLEIILGDHIIGRFNNDNRKRQHYGP